MYCILHVEMYSRTPSRQAACVIGYSILAKNSRSASGLKYLDQWWEENSQSVNWLYYLVWRITIYSGNVTGCNTITNDEYSCSSFYKHIITGGNKSMNDQTQCKTRNQDKTYGKCI